MKLLLLIFIIIVLGIVLTVVITDKKVASEKLNTAQRITYKDGVNVRIISFGNTQQYIADAKVCVEETRKIFDQLNCTTFTTVYSRKDVVPLIRRHKKWFYEKKRGYGHWMWKPFIIQQELSKCEEGDVVVYMDSGRRMADVEQAKLFLECANPIAVSRDAGWLISKLVNSETLDALGIKEYPNCKQVLASHMAISKSEKGVNLVNLWLEICELEKTIEDHERYKGNSSHDQCVLSLIMYSMKLSVIDHSKGMGIRVGKTSHRNGIKLITDLFK